jgi:hypothetical protein
MEWVPCLCITVGTGMMLTTLALMNTVNPLALAGATVFFFVSAGTTLGVSIMKTTHVDIPKQGVTDGLLRKCSTRLRLNNFRFKVALSGFVNVFWRFLVVSEFL